MSKLTTIATTLALAVLIGCAGNANKKVKEMSCNCSCVEDGDDIDTDEPDCVDNIVALPENNKDTWVSYYNKDSTRIGFKDKNGVIKTEPKFGTPAEHSSFAPRKFNDIIAVGEDVDGKWERYYFTKSGKTFGRDSVYFTGEGETDCESEGFIRFMTFEGIFYKYMRMFNKNGDVVVPAKYNYLTRVRNGMIIAQENAEKKCLDSDCEHSGFVGGKEMLLDTLGNILVDNFSLYEIDSLNFFSIQKTKTPHSDTIRKSFLARDGSYYSFINIDREFEQWQRYDLNFPFEIIVFEEKSSGEYKRTNRQPPIDNDFNLLKKRLLARTDEAEIMPEFTELDEYFDNFCGHRSVEYYTLIPINVSGQRIEFYLVRTIRGYKLIYVYTL